MFLSAASLYGHIILDNVQNTLAGPVNNFLVKKRKTVHCGLFFSWITATLFWIDAQVQLLFKTPQIKFDSLPLFWVEAEISQCDSVLSKLGQIKTKPSARLDATDSWGLIPVAQGHCSRLGCFPDMWAGAALCGSDDLTLKLQATGPARCNVIFPGPTSESK